MEVCPADAITKTKEGLTKVDSSACIGCGACVEACKYDAIKLSEKAVICDLCGGEPECVARCPTGALSYIEVPESIETPESAFKRLRETWSLE